jgi:predicted DNA-binding WGR domain protein
MNRAKDEEGKVCLPSAAERGKGYYCLECEGKVFVRQGEIRVHHFYHTVEAKKACDKLIEERKERQKQEEQKRTEERQKEYEALRTKCEASRLEMIITIPYSNSLPLPTDGEIRCRIRADMKPHTFGRVSIKQYDLKQLLIKEILTSRINRA